MWPKRGIFCLAASLIIVALFLQQGYFSPVQAQANGEPATIFTDVSRAARLVNTRHGDERAIGQAWGDFDGDGWQDLYVTDTDGPNTLFRNNGDGTFSRAAESTAVSLPNAYSGGASFVDYDNDGWPDLYVVNWGPNALFRNEEGRFVNVTAEAGVGDDANGQTASWGDYDNDGYLDLYVANWSCYPECGRPATGDSDRLYHNNGDGTFSDVTHLLTSKVLGASFIATFSDYDNDGDLDIYVVNDEFISAIGNGLWRNDGPGCDGWCFTELSEEAGVDTRVMGMGLATTDYDNDGDFDFYFSNAGPMSLLQNQGDGTFRNVAPQAGVDVPEGVAWGAVALDYDNDGWQDLYLAVMRTTDGKGIPANPLFHNNGDGTFTRVPASGANDVGPSMGVATADYDRNGRIDLVVGNAMEGYRLLQNQGSDNNHWLSLKLVGGGPVNRDAVGARVTVSTADGLTQVQEVRNGTGLGGGSELALHFGLNTAVSITELTVRWPDGREQQFRNVPANRRVVLPYPSDDAALAAQRDVLYPAGLTPTRTAADSSLALILLGALLGGTAVFFIVLLALRRDLPRRVRWRWPLLWGPALTLVLALILLSVRRATTTPQPPHPQPQDRLAQLLHAAGVTPPQPVAAPPPAQVALGEALYWDPLLSGNRDTSCASCHHPDFATGDGLAVSIGTGGVGLGPERTLGSGRELIPRNAPSVLNLGLVGMDVMFWDGRVQGTAVSGFVSPADDDLPFTLENAVAVQAMFPVTSRDEMRGGRGDRDVFDERNELASIDDHDWPAMWEALMARLLAEPAYVSLFQAAYPEIPVAELGFEHAANALAAYQMTTFTFLDRPWDQYLQGNEAALAPAARSGAELFFGKAGCAQCHNGPLLSDMQFHNIAVPSVGPGKGNEAPLDFGRARETGNEADYFAFRTPPLRDVALTGPWMHNGAYADLETAVRHHLNPVVAIVSYDTGQLTPLMQEELDDDASVQVAAVTATNVYTTKIDLSDAEIAALLAFLDSLTSPTATDLAHTIPDSVPSGLPVGGQ